jgi:hypothetical protein
MSMYEKSVESSVRSIKEGNGLSSKDIIEISSVRLEKEHVEIVVKSEKFQKYCVIIIIQEGSGKRGRRDRL